jgi:glycosyltransferase involved in cell wall biosynthesis
VPKDTTKYIIISPARNEENNIRHTLDSVVSQTVLPMKWIIVNDGSSDKTADIIKEYTAKYEWITLINLADRGYYDLMSGGEIKAFFKGFNTIRDSNYQYLAKLDGDISFDEHYFENLLKMFSSNPKLGIASGACYYLIDNKLVLEKTYKNHVRGAARIYRRECWDNIGGVIDKLSWDAIDVYKARMLGWETRSFEEIKMIHHEKTWTKGGVLHGRMRSGTLQYMMGTHPLFFCSKLAKELFQRPFIIGSCLMAYGFMKPLLMKEERAVEHDLLKYIRGEQMRRLKRFARFHT